MTTEPALKLVETPISGRACANCRFWKLLAGQTFNGEQTGECRRQAPRPAFEASVEASAMFADNGAWRPEDKNQTERPEVSGQWVRTLRLWPGTWPDDWCGEFEVAPGKGPGFV